MDAIKKNILGWVVTFVITILTSIITISLASRDREQYDLKNDVETLKTQKLDKEEFEQHKKDNEVSFEKLLNRQDIQYAKQNDKIDALAEKTIKASNDIAWIREIMEKERRGK